MTGDQPRLFADWSRTDDAPAAASESVYAFLDRSAAPPFARTRDELNVWFADLPSSAQADIRGRVVKGTTAADSALWELYLHRVFTRLGYAVEIHPAVSGISTRPDLLACKPDDHLYIEARVVSSPTQEQAALRRRERVYDGIDQTASPNFWLEIDITAEGPSDLAVRRHRGRLERWLAALDPDDAERALSERGDGPLPKTVIADDGWEVEVTAIPKAIDDRGLGSRPVGAFGPGQGVEVNDTLPFRRALESKGSRYGELGAPFLLAVSVLRDFHQDYDVDCALYGTWVIGYRQRLRAADTASARRLRLSDGYYQGTDGNRHSGVSGVLVAHRFAPWRVASLVPDLWLHPAPAYPLPGGLPFRTVDVDISTGALQKRRPARHVHDVLGLSPSWPGFPAGVA